MLLSYDSDTVNIVPSYIKDYIHTYYTNNLKINQDLIFLPKNLL